MVDSMSGKVTRMFINRGEENVNKDMGSYLGRNLFEGKNGHITYYNNCYDTSPYHDRTTETTRLLFMTTVCHQML